MVSPLAYATLMLGLLTASFGFYLYGSWLIITESPVTWAVLRRHLWYISVGFVLTTVPLLSWMLPRLLSRFGGLLTVHGFLGLQAYAFLLFAVSGIVPIVRAKRRHDLYADPEREVVLEELHENMGTWRLRLRIGVVGYLAFWLLAYLLGTVYYVTRYLAWRL
jgi:hypothetical protein